MLKGRFLITGGAGFLGRGIVRRAQREDWDAEFVIVSRDEQKHASCRMKYGDRKVRYFIGDILDTAMMLTLMVMSDFVIHAAAIKYIPECEHQPSQALRVNIDGTRSVMEAARAAGVKRTVIISTDKAAQPLNTYGMTKALCERMVFESQDLPAPSGAQFVAVRYGNVIGSTGSVWPVFMNQLTRDERLTVTEPNMTRFFIGIDEAVDLIVAAFRPEHIPGTVLIPQPRSIQIGTLADYITREHRAAGYRVVGSRPGEKRHEDMLGEYEHLRVIPAGDSRWTLFGPTVKNDGAIVSQVGGMTSDSAVRISPEEFVAIAKDSESV